MRADALLDQGDRRLLRVERITRAIDDLSRETRGPDERVN
jgi:hypothetical protein